MANMANETGVFVNHIEQKEGVAVIANNEGINKEQSAKLACCPHCGGIPGTIWIEYFLDMGCWHTARVVCGECNSIMDTHGLSKEDAINKAIQKWNKRHNVVRDKEMTPLSLDELYNLNNEPVYFWCIVGNWSLNGWHLVEPLSYANHGFKDLRLDNNENHIIETFNYGITWVAYREPYVNRYTDSSV